MLQCCFHLIANMIAESDDIAAQILQRTSLIQAVVIASENNVCSSKLLRTLVWLASLLMNQHKKLGLTRNDKLKLCGIVGRKAIQTIDDSIVSDGCWLFSYAFDTEDDSFLAEVCNVTTISNLVRCLKAADQNIQFPALKAVASMLSTETVLVVDRALFERVLDRLLAMAQ